MRVRTYHLEDSKFDDVVRFAKWLGLEYSDGEDKEDFIEKVGDHLLELRLHDIQVGPK